MRQVTVILNPTAGRGQAATRRGHLESLLSRTEADWKVVETQGPGTATALAQEAVRSDADVIVAAGGDGTLSEVLNGIVGSHVTLGLLPMGTGNDFARTLGIGLTLEAAVSNLFSGEPTPVDVGKIQDRYFLNVAGCGFDAVIAKRVNQGYRKLRGRTAYLAAVYQSLREFVPFDLELTLDGEIRHVSVMLCAIANARSYGGGMKIAPEARLNDGMFDLCLVCTSKWEFLKSFPKVFKGAHTSHPGVMMAHAACVRIATDRPIPVLVDGEIFGTTPAEFTVLPRAVSMLCPKRRPGEEVPDYLC